MNSVCRYSLSLCFDYKYIEMPWKVDNKQNSYGQRYVLLHQVEEWFSPNLKLHDRWLIKITWKALHVSQLSGVQHNLKEAKGEKLWPKRAQQRWDGDEAALRVGSMDSIGEAKMLLHFAHGLPWGDGWWPEAIYIFPLEDCLGDLPGGGDFWILRGKERKS